MKYLITGGTGFIGKNFINSLSLEDQITILSRKNIKLPGNCKVLNDVDSIKNEEEFDCIINLAGAPIDCRWTGANKRKLIDSRVKTTKSLITLIKRLKVKPKMMISASAIGFYGDFNNEILEENSLGKDSFTHELCSIWEDEASKAERYGLRVCFTRFGVVLGANGGFIKKTYFPFKWGLGGKMGNGKQLFSWIHIEDVISGIKFLIDNKNCSGAYNFVAPNTVTNEQLTSLMGKIYNKPTLFNIPTFLVKILFGEMGECLLLKGNQIQPKKLLEQGYQFKYDDIKVALKRVYDRMIRQKIENAD